MMATNDHETVPELDADTLREVAKVMRTTIEGEIPTGPIMTGAFSATSSWAQWLDDQAAQAGAKL